MKRQLLSIAAALVGLDDHADTLRAGGENCFASRKWIIAAKGKQWFEERSA